MTTVQEPLDDRRPWERRDDETDRAWAAFQLYRDMGAGKRSFAKAYQERYGKDSSAQAPQFFRTWASEHQWYARATAWDRHLDALNIQAQEEEAKRWRDRRRNLLAVYFARLAEAVDVARWIETDLTAKLYDPNKPRLKEDVQIRDLTQAVNMIANQLREEYDDLPTQRIEQMAMVVGDTLDRWSTMSDEELDQVIDNLQAITIVQTKSGPALSWDDLEDNDDLDGADQADSDQTGGDQAGAASMHGAAKPKTQTQVQGQQASQGQGPTQAESPGQGLEGGPPAAGGP
jgi:hypothetical protein